MILLPPAPRCPLPNLDWDNQAVTSTLVSQVPRFDNLSKYEQTVLVKKKNVHITESCQWVSQEETLSTHTKINSKWIRDLNVKHKTIHPFEQNIGENLQDQELGNEFLGHQKYNYKREN